MQLNDFIAHEVRNPVAAAMAACSFVRAAADQPTVQDMERLRDDVKVVDNSLKFINDLLRNLLDMHRAANAQLVVDMAPTNVLHDILEPVQGMMYQREDKKIEIKVDCPNDDIMVLTDSLRLKQIMLNLGRNSVKFVSEGFIRLSATVNEEGFVQLAVEDSGPGIPEEKRKRLFSKFQESLDVLSQGTGIGLFLCQNLVALLGGEIYLDESYDCGLSGGPGTRFVINLKAAPIMDKDLHEKHAPQGQQNEQTSSGADSLPSSSVRFGASSQEILPTELPETYSVLFVDDDAILRRLFSRTVKRVCPSWTVREAASGESCLRLVEASEGGECPFDLIFMDMYMASVEKSLLGKEGDCCAYLHADRHAELISCCCLSIQARKQLPDCVPWGSRVAFVVSRPMTRSMNFWKRVPIRLPSSRFPAKRKP